MKRQWTWVLPVLLAGTLQAQTLFEGQPGSPGNVVVMGPAEERPPELQNIELLPIDCMGRTASTVLLPECARLVTDVPGAGRLLLPGQNGSLYRFRSTRSHEDHFGLFRVRDGRAVTVFERDGWGYGSRLDPLTDKIAVARDGGALLVASVPGAGGDLWELDLEAGTTIPRTGGIAPRSFKRNGLALMTAWGFALSDQGPQRFQRSVPGRAQSLSMPVPCAWYGEDVVISRDQSTVAFVAGPSPLEARVFLCRSSGPVVLVPAAPDRIVGAGFLPEEPHGPTMALSTDGSSVAWMTQNDYSRECWTWSATRAAVQVTSDERFDDTLNDAGVLSFFDPDSLVAFVGEGQGIGEGDLYRIDLDQGLAVSNLTATSGITQPPHDYGTITAADGVFELPAGAGWLILDGRANATSDLPGRLLRVAADGMLRTLIEDVEAVQRLEPAGAFAAVVVERTPGVDVPGQPSQKIVQFSLLGDELECLMVPAGTRIVRALGSRVHDQLTVVAAHPSGEWLGQVRVPSRSGLLASNLFLRYGPTMAHDSAGHVTTSLQAVVGNLFFAWTGLGAIPLRQSPGFVLPGE